MHFSVHVVNSQWLKYTRLTRTPHHTLACTHAHTHTTPHTRMHVVNSQWLKYTRLTRTHAHTHTTPHTRMHTRTRTHTHTTPHTRMHTRTHTHHTTHSHTHTHTHTHMHTHTGLRCVSLMDCMHTMLTHRIAQQVDYFALKGILQLGQFTVIATLDLRKQISLKIVERATRSVVAPFENKSVLKEFYEVLQSLMSLPDTA